MQCQSTHLNKPDNDYKDAEVRCSTSTMTDTDHSFSQLPVHKALTYPEGQGARAVAPPLVGEGNSLNAEKNKPSVPLGSLAA